MASEEHREPRARAPRGRRRGEIEIGRRRRFEFRLRRRVALHRDVARGRRQDDPPSRATTPGVDVSRGPVRVPKDTRT